MGTQTQPVIRLVRHFGWTFVVLGMMLSFAVAEELRVGDGERFRSVRGAIEASAFGDTIVVTAGRHIVADVAVGHDLTIMGEGDVVFYADGPVAKGLLVPTGGTAITIRNITFEGARSPDKNGAGIRFEGYLLRVENSRFVRNENGILATGDEDGFLMIRNSAFLRNGHGDGYSHGVYQSHGASIEVFGTHFEGTRRGHHLKTLAHRVLVKDSSFDDGTGSTSYMVDATAGGDVQIEGNEFIRRQDADQKTLFNYDTSRGGEVGSIALIDNRLITEKKRHEGPAQS